MTHSCCTGASDAQGHDNSACSEHCTEPRELLDINLDPVSAMQRRYPRAPSSDIIEFARHLDKVAACQPGLVLLLAAANKKWNVLHEMIESGIKPTMSPAVDCYKECLPWIKKLFATEVYSFNSNMLLTVAAHEGNLTIVRYLVEKRETLNITTLGLIVLPVIRLCTRNFNDGLWLLENLPLNQSEFADASGHFLNASIVLNFHDVKLQIAAIFQRRGVAMAPLLSMYAALPQAFKLQCDNLEMDPKTAMTLKYPLVDMDVVAQLASKRQLKDPLDLAHILQISVPIGEWSIVHTLLDRGIDPRESQLCLATAMAQDICTYMDWNSISMKGNVLILNAACTGNATALRYMLSLKNQIGFSRAIYPWLPVAAARMAQNSLVLWLLDTLGLDKSEYQQSILLCIESATKSNSIHLLACLLDRVLKRADELDINSVVETCLLPSLDKVGIVDAIFNDSWISKESLAAIARRALSIAISSHLRDTTKFLQSYIAAFESSNMTAEQKTLVQSILNNDAPKVRAILDAAATSSNLDDLLFLALHRAASTGKLEILRMLFSENTKVSQIINLHLEDMLIYAFNSRDAEVLLLVNKHTVTCNPEKYPLAVRNLFRHAVAEDRICDAIPLISLEFSNFPTNEVASAAVVVTSKYGSGTDLSAVMAAAKKVLSNSAYMKAIQISTDDVYGKVGDVLEKYQMLFDAAQSDPDTYACALQNALLFSARQNSLDIISQVNLFGKWRSSCERQAALVSAAEMACKVGSAEALQTLLQTALYVPEEVRMKWAFHENTWKYALKGISTERLLEAQLEALESFDQNSYVLVRRGLIGSDPTDAQLAASRDADKRFMARFDSIQRSENGVDMGELEIISDEVPVDGNYNSTMANECCVICRESLINQRSAVSSAAPHTSSVLIACEAGNESESNNAKFLPFRVSSTDTHDVPSDPVDGSQTSAAGVDDAPAQPSDPADRILSLKCPGGHKFHKSCLFEWFGKSAQCPTCKHDFGPLLGKPVVRS